MIDSRFKKVAIISTLLLTFWQGMAFADLTKQDIEEIRKIVREEIQREIAHVNQRIDDLDSKLSTRIDSVENLLYVILAGMFALVGFVIWDRRTALAPAISKTRELEEKEGKLEKALKEFALKNAQMREALEAVGML